MGSSGWCFLLSGVERYLSGWRFPVDPVIERDHWARQMVPFEIRQHRRAEAGEVDLEDLLGAEKCVDPAAEMATRLDDDDPRLGDVETHHLKEHRVGALPPHRHDD